MHVDKFRQLPSETLRHAEKAGTAIFADAGVSLGGSEGRERAPRRDGQRHRSCCSFTGAAERMIAGPVWADGTRSGSPIPGRDTSSSIEWQN